MSEGELRLRTRWGESWAPRLARQAALRVSRGRLPWALALAAISTLLVCRASPFLSAQEFALLGGLLALRPPRTPDPRVAIVGIEKSELDEYEKNRPDICACAGVPRPRLGEALSRLQKAGAKVVVLDLILTRACPVSGHDELLAEKLEAPGETILTAKVSPTPATLDFGEPPSVFRGPDSKPHIIASPVLYNPGGQIRGVSLIQTGEPTAAERREAQPLELVGHVLPPLSLAAYAAYRGEACEIPVASDYSHVTACDIEIPVWPSAEICLFEPLMPPPEASKYAMLVNWAGPVGTFPMYALSAVCEAREADLQRWFAGGIVLLGSSTDRHHTPMRRATRPLGLPLVDQSGESGMSGLEVHANALDTIMQRRFIRPIPLPAIWAIVFACCLLTALAFLHLSTLAAVMVALLQMGVLYQLSAILVRWDHWLYMVIPTTAIALSSVATGLWGYAESRHEAATLADEVEARDATTEALVHDLKQPLAVISGLAAALRATQGAGAADASPELTRRIQDQVERALADIDELLITSPTRAIPVQSERFNLAELARDLAVAQSLRSSLHDVAVRTSAEEPWITADARYIGRAIDNLVDNAIKYWPEGGTVIVEIERRAGETVVRVIDGGLGMSPEQQSRIFRRFHRAVPEGMAIPGTGIGLFSVKRIIDAHGGSVHVQSQAGVGSTFILTIPDAAVTVKTEGRERDA